MSNPQVKDEVKKDTIDAITPPVEEGKAKEDKNASNGKPEVKMVSPLKVEVNYSKADLKELIEKAKSEFMDEHSEIENTFSMMTHRFICLLAKADVLARAATKEGAHALAGEFINLHSALSVAQNKLGFLTEAAKEYAERL
jgi:hypothetical protein